MQTKFELKQKARGLRMLGFSYSDILKEIKVSKSTLSLWLRDIKLSRKQLEEIRGRNRIRYLASKKRQKDRIDATKLIIEKAKKEAKLKRLDDLFLLGIMLYWAEGTKRGNESINFSNSDSAMIGIMMRWFREICQVPEKKFRIQIHAHSLHVKDDLVDFWSKITSVPPKQFHNLIIKETSLGQRKNILYQGTCSIRIYDVKLFRKIMGWTIGTLEEFGVKFEYKIPE